MNSGIKCFLKNLRLENNFPRRVIRRCILHDYSLWAIFDIIHQMTAAPKYLIVERKEGDITKVVTAWESCKSSCWVGRHGIQKNGCLSVDREMSLKTRRPALEAKNGSYESKHGPYQLNLWHLVRREYPSVKLKTDALWIMANWRRSWPDLHRCVCYYRKHIWRQKNTLIWKERAPISFWNLERVSL